MTGATLPTRKLASLAGLPLVVALAALAGGGCELRQSTVPYGSKPPEPGLDSAIVLRHYDSTIAMYQNTTVIAGSTRFPLVHDPRTPDYLALLGDPLVFLANTAISPVSIVVAPPYTEKTWRSTALEPTYSGNPSLDDVYVQGEGGGGAPVIRPKVRPE